MHVHVHIPDHIPPHLRLYWDSMDDDLRLILVEASAQSYDYENPEEIFDLDIFLANLANMQQIETREKSFFDKLYNDGIRDMQLATIKGYFLVEDSFIAIWEDLMPDNEKAELLMAYRQYSLHWWLYHYPKTADYAPSILNHNVQNVLSLFTGEFVSDLIMEWRVR